MHVDHYNKNSLIYKKGDNRDACDDNMEKLREHYLK